MKKVVLVFLTVLSSCRGTQIEVEHFYVSKKNLPSTFALSPDPLQDEEYSGQIFFIHYAISDAQFSQKKPIVVQFLLEDLQEFQTVFTPNQKKGTNRIEWINAPFKEHGPVIGYQVSLQDFCVKSPLFRKMIEVEQKRLKLDRKKGKSD